MVQCVMLRAVTLLLMLSWAPVSSESLLDTPLVLAIDPDREPVIAGGSTAAASEDSFTKRGLGLAVMRLIP